MSNDINVKVNQFPSLTWNSLGINNADFSGHLDDCIEPDVQFLKEGAFVSAVNFDFVPEDIKAVETGMGKDFDVAFDGLLKTYESPVHVITVKDDVTLDDEIFVEYRINNSKNYTDDVVLYAGKNSCSRFVFNFNSAENLCGGLGIRLRVFAEENSSVKVHFINLMSSSADFFISAGSRVNDNASVSFTEIDLGAKKSFIGNRIDLNGYRAASDCRSVYLVKKDASLDVNYVVNQVGKETESKMFTDGVMMENSTKVWRGTIDFKKGAADSKGDEQENVLLLSPSVVNKTLPVILCQEESVEGRHGSSIGKLGKDIFLYMQSRGIDEYTAKRILVKGKIFSACSEIADTGITENIHNYVERVLDE